MSHCTGLWWVCDGVLILRTGGFALMTVLAMSPNELSRYDTLLRVMRHELRVDNAAMLLGVSRRQISRLLMRLRADGAAGLVSRKRGKPSNRRHKNALRADVIGLVREHRVPRRTP